MARLRVLTAGESHGVKMAAIVEGLPAGLLLDKAAIDRDLARRQGGYGRGQRSQSIERDEVRFTGGVRFGATIGAPVLLEIENLDHAKWTGVMDALPIDDRSAAEAKRIVRPRPGHADLSGALKYGRVDMRDVLERASARNTNVRVAVGSIAKALLGRIGIDVFSVVTKIGGVEHVLEERAFTSSELAALRGAAEASDVGCADPEIAEAMRNKIDEARKAGDTLGGAFFVFATNVPAGLGSYAEHDRRLDGRLAQAVMSVQAVKAVEIGLGTRAGDVFGSDAHDEITYDQAASANGAGGYGRKTNRAGGLEGGVTNGQTIVVRGTMKPISTLARPLESVDVTTREVAKAAYERSDVCAVRACSVIAEAAVATCLADAALEAFGGDTVEDFVGAFERRVSRYARPDFGGDA